MEFPKQTLVPDNKVFEGLNNCRLPLKDFGLGPKNACLGRSLLEKGINSQVEIATCSIEVMLIDRTGTKK